MNLQLSSRSQSICFFTMAVCFFSAQPLLLLQVCFFFSLLESQHIRRAFLSWAFSNHIVLFSLLTFVFRNHILLIACFQLVLRPPFSFCCASFGFFASRRACLHAVSSVVNLTGSRFTKVRFFLCSVAGFPLSTAMPGMYKGCCVARAASIVIRAGLHRSSGGPKSVCFSWRKQVVSRLQDTSAHRCRCGDHGGGRVCIIFALAILIDACLSCHSVYRPGFIYVPS